MRETRGEHANESRRAQEKNEGASGLSMRLLCAMV